MFSLVRTFQKKKSSLWFSSFPQRVRMPSPHKQDSDIPKSCPQLDKEMIGGSSENASGAGQKILNSTFREGGRQAFCSGENLQPKDFRRNLYCIQTSSLFGKNLYLVSVRGAPSIFHWLSRTKKKQRAGYKSRISVKFSHGIPGLFSKVTHKNFSRQPVIIFPGNP